VHTGFLMGKQDRKFPRGRPRRRWENSIILHLNYFARAWTGLMWVRIERIGGLLCTR
jgi:hypothetical protein